MPATLLSDAAPAASAFLPTGPAAIETFPPSVNDPAWEKVFTALASLRINTKSVSSNPIWPPNPAPPVAIADGALQLPSGSRATTRPLPKRADPRNPALITVRIARPCIERLSQQPVPSIDPFDCHSFVDCFPYLCVCEYRRRNDLLGSEGLARVDEGGQDLAALLALRW